MKRRQVVGLVLVVLVAVGLWWLRRGGPPATPAMADRAAATTAPASVGEQVTARPRDPRSLARGSIAGTVRDEAKAPIAGARVCADAIGPEVSDELTREPRCVDTDAAGGFVIGDLFAAEYEVGAGARTFRPATYHPDGDQLRRTVALAAGQAKRGVDLELRHGGVEITGVVADIGGGPVARAQVRAAVVGWSDEASSPTAVASDQGEFALWVAPGQVTVSASAEGYAAGSESGPAPGRFELRLTPESGLSGTVVDGRTGAPIEGAAVEVEAAQWSWEGHARDVSDADGRFRVRRLTPGRYLATAHTAHGYGRTEGSTLLGLGQQVGGVEIKLFPAAQIVGKVMIVGASPKVCTEAGVGFYDKALDRRVIARVEPDGGVHADGVLPGSYQVDVACSGYQARERYRPVVVADRDVTGLIWEVEIGGTIRGKVRTKRGAPVEDAALSASIVGGPARAKRDWAATRTGPAGGYELRGLRTATYQLEVETDRGVAPREGFKVAVAAGATIERDLVLDDGGTIQGTVADAEGHPVAGVEIDASSLAETWAWNGQRHTSDAAGAFAIAGLRPGDYRVSARHGWSATLRKPGTSDDATQGEKATVRAAQVATVRLVVESQRGTIKGTVVDAAGVPVGDAYLSSARESDAAAGGGAAQARMMVGWSWGAGGKPVLTAPDGTFALTSLSPGTYVVRAYRKGGGEAIADHVAVGATVRLQIKPTASLSGTAKRHDGTVAEQITVSVTDPKVGFERSETFFRTGGRFMVKDLPASHVTVTVRADGGQARVEVDLAEGQARSGVDVVLEDLIAITGRIVDLVTKQPVPGIMMTARPATGGGSFSVSFGEDGDLAEISDETGRFTVRNVPTGQLRLRGFPRDWATSDYGFAAAIRMVTGSGTVDVGDLGILRKRIKDGEIAGELGVNFKDSVPGAPPEQHVFEVSYVDPAGPCAKTALKVGDVVTSIDGIGVAGVDAANASTLLNAPVGATLTLGLARGVSIAVVLGAPR